MIMLNHELPSLSPVSIDISKKPEPIYQTYIWIVFFSKHATFVVSVKSTVKTSSIFVAFLENMNFLTFCYKFLTIDVHYKIVEL